MEHKEVTMTLCIIHQHPRVLLGYKKRSFGKGRWNGFGGKVVGGESLMGAAQRELCEEVGIVARDLEEVGILTFTFDGKPDRIRMYIFRVSEFEGEPIETDEMRPAWFEIADIPFREMWPDDLYWLPYFLKGRKFHGSFHLGVDDAIMEHTIEPAG